MPVDVAARMGYRLPNIAGVLSSTLGYRVFIGTRLQ